MCHRHLKRNMSNTSPFFRPPKPPLPSHLYLVKRHRHPPSCPKHEPPLSASPFLPSHIQSEAEERLSLCSLPLLPYLRCLSPTLVASLLASCTTLCGRDKGGSTPLSSDFSSLSNRTNFRPGVWPIGINITFSAFPLQLTEAMAPCYK